jgi:class 3 adenylate cyclase
MSDREYRLAAIMFTDIAGFSEMMSTDESGTLELLDSYYDRVRLSVEEHGGRIIKKAADAVLCEFPNTVNAVKSAVDIQEGMAAHNTVAPATRYGIRIGIHLGDIYFLQDDALGEGVTIADYLQDMGTPGRICISQDVHNLIANKISLLVHSLGQVQPPKIGRQIEAFEIVVDSDAEVGKTSGGHKAFPEKREGSGSADDATYDSVKSMVLQEIKRAGRRIPVEEIRRRIGHRSARLDAILESLVEKGFLIDSDQDAAGSSSSRPSVEIHTPAGRFMPPVHGRPNRVGGRPNASRSWGDGNFSSWGDRDEHDDRGDEWDQALSVEVAPGVRDSLVEDYRDHAADVAEKEKAGFRAHLISYLAVNGGLFFLWSTIMFGGFPWFVIVAAGWGIGLVSHFTAVRERMRESRELDRFQGLTREQLRIYRKLAKARSNFSGHLISNLATGAFLALLNLIVSPGFFWAVFPIGFMAIGVLSHLPAFKSKEHRLLKRLREAGANIGYLLRRGRGDEEAPAPVTGGRSSQEAEQIRQRITAALGRLPEGSPIGDEITPILDSYVDQIKLLDQKNIELDTIMRDIPIAALDRDLAMLRGKRDRTEDRAMIEEYDKQIHQIEKHQSSQNQLKNEREMMRVRLNMGLNQLRQMEIDLARMTSLSDEAETSSFALLKDKSDELAQYLDDLEAGFRELE